MRTVVEFLDGVIKDLDASIFIANSDPSSIMPVTLNFAPSEAEIIRDALKSGRQHVIDSDKEKTTEKLRADMLIGALAGGIAFPDPTIEENKPLNPYELTVDGMLSADYKERFKAEYQQLKIRTEKLNAFCNKIEASFESEKKIDAPKHDCAYPLLMRQLGMMREYLHILEVRAVIEGIELQ